MKAITVRQPWASLIAAGVKTIETRSWRTDYRGPIAIHAGRHRPDPQLVAAARPYLPTGSIEDTDIADQLPFGDFTDGRYGWLLEGVQALHAPVLVKGKQGLWEWAE